LKGALAAFYRN